MREIAAEIAAYGSLSEEIRGRSASHRQFRGYRGRRVDMNGNDIALAMIRSRHRKRMRQLDRRRAETVVRGVFSDDRLFQGTPGVLLHFLAHHMQVIAGRNNWKQESQQARERNQAKRLGVVPAARPAVAGGHHQQQPEKIE